MIDIFDHPVYLTTDLGATVALFERAGFTTSTREDKGESISDHCYVCFDDGSYIEVFSFRNDAAVAGHRWFPATAYRDGFCDYSLHSPDLVALTGSGDKAGIKRTEIVEGGKERADGMKWEVKMAMFGLGVGRPEYPFVLEDKSPRRIRVSGETSHPNGASHIQAVTIVSNQVEAVRAGMMALTDDSDPEVRDTSEGRSTTFSFNGRSITLLEPADPWDTNVLAQRGPHIKRITVASSEGGPTDLESLDALSLELVKTK